MSGFIIHSSLPFEKDLNRLAKKYPQIRNDIQEAFAKVQSSNIIGSAIPGGKGKLHKLRVSSSDLKRGKGGGFRVVFYLQAPDVLWPIISQTRRALKAWLRRKIEQKIARGEFRVYTRFGGRLD